MIKGLITGKELMNSVQANRSGPGWSLKVLEGREIIQVGTERKEFREGPGITITHVHNKMVDYPGCCMKN
jgi:hypothetical protein